ncbi:HAMP domain-containing protein [Actinomadura darangshiensis]|uniref:histidine kinase n=1 Tax=Actinomadura darangshiensis TaxID=705336 RepID=A0A4R5ATP6_9ACTN|nr:ATP-binding protein [Actinomadura darangshiensis]TDD76668.1 HAMP domain-containing protein [Actinomadura darangshiensis]
MTVRARMTLLYGGLFTVITLSVLGVAVWIQKKIISDKVQDVPFNVPAAEIPCARRPPELPCADVPFRAVEPLPPAGQKRVVGPEQFQDSLVDSQRVVTLVALLVIIVLAFAVSWWLTGRLLRPLHRITGTARRLSLSTLHERIALDGPQDELRQLADTFDAMLDRLEQAVDSQRRFVANASHELRTPLAIQRTAIEVGLADPTPERLAEVRAEMLLNTRRSERLIEGLLVLAQGERGLDARGPVDLEAVTGQVVEDAGPLAEKARVTVTAATEPVTVTGDEVLLTRMVANLVQNAIQHNQPGGDVRVDLSRDGLVVRNTGPRVPPERVDDLFEPFRRLHADRTGSDGGAGLGLSIVAAIVHAHDGTVKATAGPDGGLSVAVALPAAPHSLRSTAAVRVAAAQPAGSQAPSTATSSPAQAGGTSSGQV